MVHLYDEIPVSDTLCEIRYVVYDSIKWTMAYVFNKQVYKRVRLIDVGVRLYFKLLKYLRYINSIFYNIQR